MKIKYIDDGVMKIGVDSMMPYRKKPCLVIIEGNTETKYASFNNKESAELFMQKLAEFVGAEEQTDGKEEKA